MADINGNEFDNELDGTSGADVINGFGGDDYIDGKDGNDSIFGGSGDDDLEVVVATTHLMGVTAIVTARFIGMTSMMEPFKGSILILLRVLPKTSLVTRIHSRASKESAAATLTM